MDKPIIPNILPYNSRNQQFAAFLVKIGKKPSDQEVNEVKELFSMIEKIWMKWTNMESGNNSPIPKIKDGKSRF